MPFKSLTVSAPSKLILHGEHSVVYGKTALAGSLDLRTRMRIGSRKDVIEVDFPDIGVKQKWKLGEVKAGIFYKRPHVGLDTDQVNEYFLEIIHGFLGVQPEDNLVMASLICFFYLYAVICEDEAIPMSIKVESEIPIGAGLGSSAALSVCLAAGLLNIKSQIEGNEKAEQPDHSEICKLAYLSEKILHGNPSGVDNSVSTYGGVIKFVSGQVNMLSSLPKLRILLVNTNVSRNTKLLVQKVRDQFIAMPRVVKTLLDAMDDISVTCLETLEEMADKGDTKERYQTLEKLIDYNQKLLEALNVSHPALEDICETVADFGLHAKLTGAGGGGFAYVLIPPYVSEKSALSCKEMLFGKGYTCWETDLGVSGVKILMENR
jgi:mevalonate kinase